MKDCTKALIFHASLSTKAINIFLSLYSCSIIKREAKEARTRIASKNIYP